MPPDPQEPEPHEAAAETTDAGTLRLLRAALQGLPAGVALVEAPGGRVLFRNEQASLIFGGDPAATVADYGRHAGCKADGTPYTEEDWPLARSIRGGEVVAGEEAEIVRADGSRGFIRMSSAPVRDAEGRIVAGVVTVHDITTRQRSDLVQQIAARLSVALTALEAGQVIAGDVRRALGAAAAVVWLLDEQSGLLEFTAAEGYPTGAVDGYERLSLDDPLPPCDAIRRREPLFLESPQARKDLYPALDPRTGGAFQAWAAVPLLTPARVVGVAALSFAQPRRFTADDARLLSALGLQAAQAITRARLYEAEQRARAAAEALQKETAVLYRLSDAANRAASPDEVFVAALDAIREVLGAERASVLTFDGGGVMRFRAWRGLSEEYRSAVEGHSPWPADATDPRPVVVADVELDAGLAAYRPLFEREGIRALAFIPLVYGDRLLGKFMLYAPVPRALGAAELERAGAIAAQVASAVGRAQSQQALRDANRRKDEFLAMLSHELRNPLAAARNAVHLLTSVAADEESRRRWIEVISRQTGNLVRIVDDLLDVSRITRGRIELRHEPTDLRVVVQRALSATSDLLARHRLTVSLPEAPLPVNGDPVRLEQVFLNLLANAGKYTPAGGAVEVAAGRQGEEVVARVRDAGIGIESERLGRVFDLFDQGGRDLARTQGGLGVGLTIVRGLVELHGGRVEAASAGAGRGSEFVVRLPARAGAALTEKAAVPPAAAAARRVLVVDDHVDSCEMLAALLQAWGHAVDVVTEASAVVDRVRAGRPDLVLLDIGLPGMDGYELAQVLSADPHTRASTLVALTGYGQPADRERALASGFAHHLVKPVQPEALRALLGTVGADPAAAS